MAATRRSTPLPNLPPGATPPVPGTVSPRPPRPRRRGPPGPTPPGTVTRPVPPAAAATAPLRGGSMEGGGLPPPPPQYQPAPREAPQDPPTPPDWPDSSDEARSRKRRRSRSLPARRTSLHRSTIMMTHGFGRPPWSCYSSLLRTTTGSLSALLDCRRSIPGGMK